MAAPQLTAHWSFDGNTNDSVGSSHGAAANVAYVDGPTGGAKAALFNGRDSVVTVPDSDAVHIRNHDFSLSMWVKCHAPMRGAYGDLLSKFDVHQRCGVNLWIAGSAPGYNGMSDARHVHFGIDDGYLGPWEDCGRPWPSNPLVPTLVSYRGNLYGGLADASRPEDACRVFRWTGGQQWEDCGRLGSNPEHLSVMSMVVHDDQLYAGTGLWDWGKAGEAAAANPKRALTHVFRYEGGREWTDLGQVGNAARVLTMQSFEGELYVGLDRGGGAGWCYKHDGSRWIDCGGLNQGDNFECLFAIGGTLYGSSHFAVYRYDGGTTWTELAREPHGITQIHAMHEIDGKLAIGTWPQGYVLRMEDDGSWTNTGRLGISEGERMAEINEINALLMHNGKFYAGVLPKAHVYRYERDGQWTLLANLASRADYDEAICPTWNRVVSLTTHNGKMFAATGASQSRTEDVDAELTVGRVLAVQAGQVVDHAYDIGGEWTHIAAVREGKHLNLYVNGELSAHSVAPAGHSFDLANPLPLLIGRGTAGSFDGAIADVRLYRGALGREGVADVMRG